MLMAFIYCFLFFQSNRQYVAEFVGNLLLSSFPNLTKAQVAGFVAGLLNSGMDLTTFKLHLRDFLVTLKVRIDLHAWSVVGRGRGSLAVRLLLRCSSRAIVEVLPADLLGGNINSPGSIK